MQQRRQLVIGNWKMNGSLASNAALVDGVEAGLRAGTAACDVALCVPFAYLAQAAEALRGSVVALGAQDVSEHESGAYTGETSAAMLLDFACRYVIVGHSERRTWFGDTDERVAAKTTMALSSGLTPVVCVGETLEERETGRAADVVKRQLDAVTRAIGPARLASIVVAYEPVWAIGTGKTATPDEAQAMHAMIRRHLATDDGAGSLRILYGGSVRAANAASLFSCDDIDGGLIGGASLVVDDFLGIVRATAAPSTEMSASTPAATLSQGAARAAA